MRALAAARRCAYHRYTWRRGSVPLWWSVNIRNGGMGEAEIRIQTANTFRGSRRCALPAFHLHFWEGGKLSTCLSEFKQTHLHCKLKLAGAL